MASPLPASPLEDAALARVTSRAPRCGLRAACVPTRASQSRSVQAPNLPSSGPQEQPAGPRCSRESFLRPTCHPAHPLRPRAFAQPLACILSRLRPCLCPATWLAPPQKQERKESDGLHRRELEEKTRRGSPRICWRSRRWLRRGVPGGRRQRRRTPTHFGCLYRQTTTSALQRCAPAAREELLLPPRASVLPQVRAVRKAPLALTDASAAES